MVDDRTPDDPSASRSGGRFRRTWDRARASGHLRWVALAAIVLLLLGGSAWYTCGFRGCPDPETLLAYEPGGAPIVLDREGEQIATLLPVQREIVALDSLPEHVGQAFIAVEDRRFRSHGGVDLRRVAGALVANIREGGVAEGGSTITMQLARNAFPDRLPASERTLTRKILETRVAMAIEDEFDKDQILGLYLNQIYFGNGATGISAASRHYFGTPPTELSPEQSALLAAMVKAPAHYDPREDTEEARERRDLVLDLMLEAGFLTEEEHRAAQEKDIEVVPYEEAADAGETLVAPWFLEAVRRELEERLGADVYRTQVRVRTTMASGLQVAAEEALQAQLRRVESGAFGSYSGGAYDPDQPPGSEGAEYLQGAVVVMDPRAGDVLALVGGRNHRHSAFDHVLDAQRQIGSAFKPFVYGAAVAEGLGPSHRLDDTPISIEMRGSPTYEPSNYDGEFRGPMTAREALRQSRNVPTVRLAQEVGTGAVAEFAREAGMDADIPEGPSMALGTVTLSPMGLARAYAAFAGLGTAAAEPRYVLRVETAEGGRLVWEAEEPEVEERIEPAVAYVVNDMLKGVVDGGTGSAVRAAGFRGPAAGKTGTTQEAADVWFVGYTPEAVGVVWMGFDQPKEILPRASGGTLAAPVWGTMMAKAGMGGSDWSEPEGVVRMAYDPATGRPLSEGCGGGPADLFLRDRMPEPSCRAPSPPPDSLAPMDTFGRGPGMGVDSLRRPGDTFQPPPLPDSGWPGARPLPSPVDSPSPVDPSPTPPPVDTVRPTPRPPTPAPPPSPTPAPPPRDTMPPPDTVGSPPGAGVPAAGEGGSAPDTGAPPADGGGPAPDAGDADAPADDTLRAAADAGG